MLYDRNVDNNEIGRKIWKICIAFNNDLRSRERFMIVEWFLNVEWFVLHWMIFTTLNDMYYVEWFVLRWMICITLNDLYYVEWFVLRWMICTALHYLTELNYLQCSVEWFVLREWFLLRWMICIMLNDFHNVERFFTLLQNLYVLDWFVQPRNYTDDLYNLESFGLLSLIEYRLFNECQECLFEKIL